MPDDFTKRVKIYYDAEFTGLHRDTTLISVGFVSQSGAYFYAEFNDYDANQIDEWLQTNIIDNLVFKDKDQHHLVKEFYSGSRSHMNVMMKNDTATIKSELLSWLRHEYESYDNVKLQFYTDCYAYDWVMLMNLICEDGKALNIPEFIDYIPMDLSTTMFIKGIDPDINREEYAGQYICDKLRSEFPFKDMGENAKHNSLWDATISVWCWYRLLNPGANGDTSNNKVDPV